MLLFIDFETFYTREYSLRKMTTVEYLHHPLYETIGAAVAVNDGKSIWLWGEQLPEMFARVKARQAAGEKVQMVSHNIKFDGAIAAWKFDFVPDLYVDTMGMAQALLAHKLRRMSLDSVGQHLGVGVKGTALAAALGWSKAMIQRDPAMRAAYTAYAGNDNEMCRGIFRALRGQLPPREFMVMDTVIRMFTQPQLTVDINQLTPHLARVKQRKQELLDKIGLTNNELLMSNDKFAQALLDLGVDPPTKISAATGKEAYAFAKNDPGLKELAEHDNPEVQNLVAARLGHKSTLEETRTEKFIRIATLYPKWPTREAMMPIPLRYSAAHTHRLGGADGLNMQNLPRVDPKDPIYSGTLRRALVAPKGYVIVSVDLSQIEARVVCYLSGALKLLQVFAEGGDVYAFTAKEIGAMPSDLNDKEDGVYRTGRQLGKGVVLGCGFGMGPPKFQITVRAAPYFLTLDLEEAERAVRGYRNANPEIPRFWRLLQDGAKALAYRETQGGHKVRQQERFELPMGYEFAVDDNAVVLVGPSGLALKYEDLHIEGRGDLWFEYQGVRKYTYGGKLCENYVQHFARCIIMDAGLRIRAQTGFSPALQVHDENVFVVPERHADDFLKEASALTVVRPKYCHDLPIACEAKMGKDYASSH